MPDDTKNVIAAGQSNDAGEKNSNAGADQKPAATGEQGNKPAADDNKKTEDGQANKADPTADKSNSQNDDDAEPTVRKRLTPFEQILKRKNEKIEKLKAKAEKNNDTQEEEEEEKEEESEIAPEDETLVNRVVAKNPVFNEILKTHIQQSDDKEVADFLKANPDFAPYEAKARKFMAHPSRRQLPVEAIFYEVAGKNLIKIGAERERKATESAKQGQTGGGSTRNDTGEKPVWNMSPQEFEAHKEKVRQQSRG